MGKGQKRERQFSPVMTGKLWLLLLPMAICTGSYTSAAYCHLSVFMTSEGISPHTASIVILLSGLGVTTSKLVYGWAAERVSAYWANWMIGSLSAIGMLICYLAGNSVVGMGAGIVIYSLGLGMTTIGLTLWASQLSQPKDFDTNNRRLQVGYVAGGLIFSSVPGILADMNRGSYKLAILLFAVTSAFAVLAIQGVYNKAKVK